MNNKNMTALVSCFAKAYHYENNKCRILDDSIAKLILRDDYDTISANMTAGIKYFNPNFSGTEEEALRWIVDNQLSPSVLGRSVFCEKALATASKLGCNQYLIYASGYDTFAYRNKNKNLKIFEIDRADMITDKLKRLDISGIAHGNIKYINCDFTTNNWINSIVTSTYNPNNISFNSLLGINYYLSKEVFKDMIRNISNIICEGSSIIFDYPTYDGQKETLINEQLATEANEPMRVKYTYTEIEKILEDNGLLVYQDLDDIQLTDEYFNTYNTFNPTNKIKAPKGIHYCLAIKKNMI